MELLEGAGAATVAARLVGRDRERAVLARALAAAVEGRGGMVALVGESGIGKTRLARTAGDEAIAARLPVLRGRAVDGAAQAAFRPLAEALCSAVRVFGLPEDAALAPFRGLLGRLIPEWSAQPVVEMSLVALGEAVLRFLRVLAARTASLLVLEDLHWADPETLAVVEYLADNIAGERICCVVSARDDTPTPGLELVHRLAARQTCVLLQLTPLTPVEVRALVVECLDDPAVPDDIIDFAGRAGGVPLLVEAMLLAAISEGALVAGGRGWRLAGPGRATVPVGFADSVRLRMAVLDEPARDVVRAAAVLGCFDTELLAETAGAETVTVISALRAATAQGLLTVGGIPPAVAFRHALARDAVRASLFPPERAAVARRALEALTARHPGLPGNWCELAAELALQADQPRRAAGLLHELGRRALHTGALVSAAALLRRAHALAHGDDAVQIAADLVDALTQTGNYPAASAIAAGLLGGNGTAPPQHAAVRVQLARAAATTSRWASAREQLELARAVAPAGDDRLGCRLDALDAVIAVGEDDPSRAGRLAEHAVAAAQREGVFDAACEALEVLGRCVRPRDLDAAEIAFGRQEELAREQGLALWRVRAQYELGIVDLLRAVDLTRLEQARDLAAQFGALAIEAVAELHLCAGLLLRGEDAASRDAALRSAELGRRYGMTHTVAAALGFLALGHARAGDGEGMSRLLVEADAHAAGDASFPATAACARAMLAFVTDDRHAALHHLDAVAEYATASGQIRSQDPALAWRALLHAVGSNHDALADARREGEPVNVVCRGFLRYADAVVSGRAGDADMARAAMDGGDRLLADLAWLRHFARRWVAEAAVADGWGEPVVWLREAEAMFTDAGQPRLAAGCRSLLRRAGAPVPRRRRDTEGVPFDLRGRGVTAREYEVLSLLAEGLSNATIATRLYLSPRTVERHIANVCAKVGLQRRAQLVALAARSTIR